MGGNYTEEILVLTMKENKNNMHMYRILFRNKHDLSCLVMYNKFEPMIKDMDKLYYFNGTNCELLDYTKFFNMNITNVKIDLWSTKGWEYYCRGVDNSWNCLIM